MFKKFIFILFSLFIFLPSLVFAKSGCCSHHGGVSGCSSSGRQICNDGTLSPTCTCNSYSTSDNSNSDSSINNVYGCTDSTAKNYDVTANDDDGSCEYYTYGCTDSTASNYDALADKDDNSCLYESFEVVQEGNENVTYKIVKNIYGMNVSKDIVSKEEIEEGGNIIGGIFVILFCIVIVIIFRNKKINK